MPPGNFGVSGVQPLSNGATGTSFDKRSPKKTPPDYLGRNDPATVYGSPGKYVVVNDRTGEVTQISDKTDPGWVDDSRIQKRHHHYHITPYVQIIYWSFLFPH